MDTNKSKNNSFDIRRFIQLCKNRWYWFVVSLGVCGIIGVVCALATAPKYQVVANILIESEDGGTTNGLSEIASQFSVGNMMGGTSSVDDEINVVRSHSNLRQTVKDLGLNITYNVKRWRIFSRYVPDKTPIVVTCDSMIADTLKSMINFKVVVDDQHRVDITAKVKRSVVAETENKQFPVVLNTPYGSFTFNSSEYLKKDKGVRMSILYCSYDAAAEALGENVAIYIPSKRANVISLNSISTAPEFTQKILDRIIENYNILGIREKRKKDQKTAVFVDERLQSITEELNTSEENIEIYKKEHDLIDVQADVTKWMGRSTSLESQIMYAKTDLHVLDLTCKFLEDPKNNNQLIPALNVSAAVPIDSYNNLLLQRMSLEENAKGNNSVLRQLDEKISVLRQNMIVSLRKAYENAKIRLSDLEKETKTSKSRLGEFPMHERQFGNIKRQQSIKEELYLYLLTKKEETNIALANAIPRGKIIDNAFTLSEPVNLSKKMVVAIAIFFGIIIPIILLFFKEQFKNKFETTEELECLTNVPILGEICTRSNHGSPLVVRSSKGSSSVAELFRLIRTNLQFVFGNTIGSKVILMTSTISGEGKSFVSINLASSFAVLGKKTLLIGLDIRNPKLEEYLDIHSKFGFTQYIANESIPVEDIILKEPLEKNMDIITAGQIPPNPSELLQSERVDALFAHLREIYDYIVVDSAPVGMVSDSFTLDRVSDVTVYVTRANYTTHKEITFLNKLYSDKRLRKMTLVLNGTKAKAGYGYGYGQQVVHES